MNYENFKLKTDENGITWIGIDVAGSNVNTMGTPVLVEFAALLDQFDKEPPKAVVFHSLKSSGFIAGANIQEFEAIGKTDDVAAAEKLIKTGYDLYERLAAVKYPTLALIKGFCMGGGLELAIWCDLRVAAADATLGVYCRRWGVPLVDGGTERTRPGQLVEALRIGAVLRQLARQRRDGGR